MFLLAWNVAAYVMSEDYRFFLKKLKYQNEVVYDEQVIVDDTERLIIIDNPDTADIENTQIIVPSEGVTFLEALSWGGDVIDEESLPKVTIQELEVLDALWQVFVFREVEQPSTLFWITDEYPDEYREYNNAHMSLYMFSSKRYSVVKNIFEVLSYDLPMELNEVNNILDASFFINMQENFDDGYVRIIFEYENYAFWLKIKKDNYNSAKNALESLKGENNL